jgi:rhodanese-related sulfurtransferase
MTRDPGTRRTMVEEIGPDDVATWQERGARIIDVREAWEYRQGHVPGAENVPLAQFVGRVSELRFPLVLVCASGNRSAMAAEYLIEQGHDGVANLVGGTVAWRERGLPIARP